MALRFTFAFDLLHVGDAAVNSGTDAPISLPQLHCASPAVKWGISVSSCACSSFYVFVRVRFFSLSSVFGVGVRAYECVRETGERARLIVFVHLIVCANMQ